MPESQGDLKEMMKRLLNRALTAESKFKNLTQLFNSSKEWSINHDVEDLIADAVSNQHKLPAHTIVPHMRRLTDFPSDFDAIKFKATIKELELARNFLQDLKPEVHIHDFIALGIYNAVAAMDREKSGQIMLSSDLAWGLVRLPNKNDAKFVIRATVWHEIGHDIWYRFRGNKQGHSPETFKGANSKTLEGEEVIRSRFMMLAPSLPPNRPLSSPFVLLIVVLSTYSLVARLATSLKRLYWAGQFPYCALPWNRVAR